MIHSIEQAFSIIEEQIFDIPYKAIKYLQTQPNNQLIDKRIQFHLEKEINTLSEYYFDEDFEFYLNTPLWYAIVAENHINDSLIDLIIELSIKEFDNDFLREQFLRLEKIAIFNGYSEKVIEKKLSLIEKYCNSSSTDYNLSCLFDGLEYIEQEKDKERLFEIFQLICKRKFYDFGALLPFIFAEINYTKVLPYLEEELKKHKLPTQKQINRNPFIMFTQANFLWCNEITGTIEIMNDPIELQKMQEELLDRTVENWQERYSNDYFSEEAHLQHLAQEEELEKSKRNKEHFDFFNESETYTRETKIGRNDPCPCGSSKKFKKCCLSKNIY